MGKKLVITEKPSVAQEFAKVLHVSGGKQEGRIENEDWIITWCVGHLVRLSYPEKYDSSLKEWRLDSLPFLPDKYLYEVIPETAKQYKIVHSCLHREDVDTVYWAGDSGREGQLIEELIRLYGGVRAGIHEKRIWIDSQTEEAILNGIRDAKEMSSYQGIANAGLMRGIEDYAMGINFSRALSLRYGGFAAQASGDPRKRVIAVGRVMSCVLAMVVEREREISNFKETLYYRIRGLFDTPEGVCEINWKESEISKYYQSPELYNSTGFKDIHIAESFVSDLKNSNDFGEVKELMHKDTRKSAPLLFNLAELQSECTKRFHISPSETLAIAQSLYEKKLTTYPRTDARVLSSSVASVIDKNICGLSEVPELREAVSEIVTYGSYSSIGKSKYTDDDKISDHYAIIPTGQITALATANNMEREVFLLICRRFLAIFCEPALYDQVSITVGVGKEEFSLTRKILKKAGFYHMLGLPDENKGKTDNQAILSLKEGMTLAIKDIDIKESKTSPPSHYTSGSMILAMENAGQLIEDEELREQIKGCGIGTSATRSNIIDKLVRNTYILQNSKTQVLTPSNIGEVVYEIVKETVPEFLVPETTAEWERELADIEHGFVDRTEYQHKIENFIREKIENIVKEDRNLELEEITRPFRRGVKQVIQRHQLGVRCPKCGGAIISSQYGFSCENNRKDKTVSTCDFYIGSICGVLLSDEQARELIIKKKTGPVDGLKGKAGKFRAYICMDVGGDKTITIRFEFPEAEPLENVKCPKCGGRVLDNHGKGFVCVHNTRDQEEKSCDFFIWKFGGKCIPKGQVVKLLNNGITDVIEGFKSAKNPDKTFAAALVWDNEEQRVKYKMTSAEAVNGLSCPKCQGKIMYQAGRGYFCENNHAGSHQSCDFFVSKICGVRISEDILRIILSGKKTEAITGFKSASGKEFSAALEWNADEGKISFVQADDRFVPKAKCPLCKGRILILPGYGYKCEHNQKDSGKCGFFLGKVAGKLLSTTDIQELLLKGKTDEIKGFTSKAGKKFSAHLKLNPDKSGVEFEFEDSKKALPVSVSGTNIVCPKCGGKLYKTRFNYECGCGYQLPYEVAGHEFTEDELDKLMSGQEIYVKGFISKKGKMFNGFCQMDEFSGRLKPIRFEDKEALNEN